MDRSQYIHMRKGRYMAQTLEAFERDIEPHVPKEVAEEYKALTRRKIGALAKDCIDIIGLDGQAVNAHAQDIRDRLQPDHNGGQASARSTTRGGS